MENLPSYVGLVFSLTVFAGILLFFKATGYSRPFVIYLLFLAVIQSYLARSGFYNDPRSMASQFPLLVIPLMVVFVSLFFTKKGRGFIDSLDIKTLTILHVVRIPVEIVLFWLYVHKAIPQAMTFEGRNFDILSGLTAPFIYYFSFVKPTLSKKVLVAWNVVCILLLLNVVSSAILSLPGRFEKFGFEQPNLAVGYFPFILLPAILVPIVLFANAAAIRQLVVKKSL